MIRIKSISMDSPMYAQAVELRTRILLAPIGFSIQDYYDMSPGREERSEHFVAVIDHSGGERVVGTATLLPPRDGENERFGRVQQVCVDPQRQNEGIGRRLMIAIEARAFGSLELPGLYCHAQLVAIPFYDRLGWSVASDTFNEAGIKHRRMEVGAPPADVSGGADLEFELDEPNGIL
ncbi:MAG: GNAT family N-acetyltransferase [Planctomycetota bacterium]